MLWRIVGSILGAALIILGLPLMISPIPLGIFLIFIGFVVLIASNPWVANQVRNWRRKNKTVDEFFHKAEEVLPDPIAEPLHGTDACDRDDATTAKNETPPMMRKIRNPKRMR